LSRRTMSRMKSLAVTSAVMVVTYQSCDAAPGRVGAAETLVPVIAAGSRTRLLSRS